MVQFFKNLLVSMFLLLFFSFHLFGATFNPHLAVRSDYQINDSDDKGLLSTNKAKNGNKELESRKFALKRANLKFDGQVDEDFTYFVSWNLNNSSGSTEIEEVYGDYKLSDQLTLRLGKLYSGFGGLEGDLAPQDVYLFSLARDDASAPTYKLGLSLNLAFKDQSINFMLLNPNTTANQTDFGYGIVWYGNLMNEMIRPIVSYHFIPTAKQDGNTSPSGVQTALKKSDHFIAVGSEFNLLEKQLQFQGDFLSNSYKSKTVDNKTDSLRSYILSTRYNHKKNACVVPLAKLELSQSKVADDKEYDRTGYSLGFEFFPRVHAPKGDNKLIPRIHLVYTSHQDKYKKSVAATATTSVKTNGTKITTSQILAGLTFKF